MTTSSLRRTGWRPSRRIRSCRVVAAALAVAWTSACEQPPPAEIEAPPPPPPNVVLFVGDGFGVGAWSVGREFARHRGSKTVLDDAPHVGFLETHCADEPVTDSAAAATAWSTGKLANRHAIGSQDTPPRPGLFERLRDADRAHGFVTTTRVTHATPAPFYARGVREYEGGGEDRLAEQLIAAAPTVVIGGGREHFVGEAGGGRRDDGVDLLVEARVRGLTVLEDFVDPVPVDAPVLMLLAPSHLPHELDRGSGPDLGDLVTAAIARLEAEGKPYFLLVEEGRIDSACHNLDGPGLAHNVLRLDRAVQAALKRVDLARTLVVVAADHSTSSPALHEAAHPESLDIVSMSVERMEQRIFRGKAWSGTPRSLEARALPVLDAGARHTGLEPTDLDRLLTAPSRYDRAATIGKAISRRFGISFLSYRDYQASTEVHGHTATPVPVRAWGVRADEVAGVRDHAEFGRWLRNVMDLDAPSTPARGAESTSPDVGSATESGVGGASPIDTAPRRG